MTIHLRGMPNQWDEWRPSKLNCYEDGGEGDATGTSGDQGGGSFGDGAQDGSQGGPGGPGFGDNLGDVFGPEGTVGDPAASSNFGQNLGDVFGPDTSSTFGQNLGDVFGPDTSSTFGQNLGDVFGPDTSSTFGQNLGDVFGPDTSSTFGQNLGDVFGPDTSSTFGQNLGDVFGPDTSSTFGQNLGDVFGPETVGPSFTTDPTGRSGMDMDFDPHSIMDLPTIQDIQNMNPATPFDPMSVPDINTIGQLGGIGVLGAPGTFGQVNAQSPQSLNIGPLDPSRDDPSLPPAMEKGDINALIDAYGRDPTAQQTPDARSAVQGILDALQSAGRAASENFGFVGKAGAETVGKDQSQFPGVASPLSNPDPNQGNLNAAFNAMNAMNTQQAQSNPGLMAAMQSFANPEDPGAKGVPGLALDPEVGRTMETGPHNQPSIAEFWEGTPSISRSAEDNPFVSNPFADRGPDTIDPGRTMEAPHNQPSIAEFWEGSPSISRGAEQTNPFALTNPYADNPDVMSGRDQLAQDLQNMQQANPYGMQQDDSRAGVSQQQINEAYQPAQQQQDPGRDPVAINPQDVPTPEQMQTARDQLAQDLARGPTNQPSIDEFWEGIPAISRSQEDARDNPFVQNPYVDEPPDPEQVQQARDMQEAKEQAARDQALKAQEDKAVERAQQQQERGPTQFSPGRTTAQVTVNPSRGQTQALGRGPGITSLGRGADRGTGRDAPGVQGLPAGLRGNDMAQALVSRGFDANLVGAALTINDGGKMLSSMLEAAGLSHSQAQATANAARGAVEAQLGLPSNRR